MDKNWVFGFFVYWLCGYMFIQNYYEFYNSFMRGYVEIVVCLYFIDEKIGSLEKGRILFKLYSKREVDLEQGLDWF